MRNFEKFLYSKAKNVRVDFRIGRVFLDVQYLIDCELTHLVTLKITGGKNTDEKASNMIIGTHM